MFVSVVMAVYNGEDFLQEAIDSILFQTYSDIELIIVNDASTDNTRKILEEINDTRVTVLHLKENKGAAHALNFGIEHAKGEWIAIHDADDISFPKRIEEQVEYIKNRPNLVAVGSFIECITDSKSALPHSKLDRTTTSRNFNQTSEEIRTKLYNYCPLTHGSVMFSKKAFLEVGKYDPSFRIAYDYDLWTRLVTIGDIEKVPKKLYKYRLHHNSISTKGVHQMNNEMFRSFSKYIKYTCYYKYKNKNPSMVIFGTKNGTRNFEIQSKKYLAIKEAIHSYGTAHLKKKLILLKKNEIDGIIVLTNFKNNSQINALEYLKKHNKILNKNLFMFYSFF